MSNHNDAIRPYREVLALAGGALLVGVLVISPGYTFVVGWNWWLYGWGAFLLPCAVLALVFLASMPVYDTQPARQSGTEVSRHFWWLGAVLLTPMLVSLLAHGAARVGWMGVSEALYSRRLGLPLIPAGLWCVSGIRAMLRGWWWRPTWVAALVFVAFMVKEAVAERLRWSVRARAVGLILLGGSMLVVAVVSVGYTLALVRE